MPSLQKIKSRITTVETTRKITKAMELVSSAKHRKSKQFLQKISEYVTSIEDTFTTIYYQLDQNELPFHFYPQNPKLLVIFTSDLGLCGAYNNNTAKLVKKHYQQGDKVIIVGTKGMSLLRDDIAEADILKTYLHVSYDVDIKLVKNIEKTILKTWEEQNFSAIQIFYTKEINSISSESVMQQVFPLLEKPANTFIDKNMEFEPNKAVVLEYILPLFLNSQILKYFAAAKVSEMSSRMNAMKNATNNADEINHYLKLLFNKSRQSNITQEINEIVSGSLGEERK
ncbi:ATP synthase F1 subunit gamma [Candidatus Mycoplasma pogonae]